MPLNYVSPARPPDCLGCSVHVQEKQEIESLVSAGAVSPRDVSLAQRVFAAVDSDGNRELSKDELKESGILEKLPTTKVDESSLSTVDDFLAEFDADGNGEISLKEFVLGTMNLFGPDWAEDATELEQLTSELFTAVCDDASTECLVRDDSAPSHSSHVNLKHTQRFNMMVKDFGKWETLMGRGEFMVIKSTRLREVLDGCFVGARTDGVVTALRIVYEDYAPLRVAGDMIFKLMRTVVRR